MPKGQNSRGLAAVARAQNNTLKEGKNLNSILIECSLRCERHLKRERVLRGIQKYKAGWWEPSPEEKTAEALWQEMWPRTEWVWGAPPHADGWTTNKKIEMEL